MLFGPLRTVDLFQRRYGMDYYSYFRVIPVRINIRKLTKSVMKRQVLIVSDNWRRLSFTAYFARDVI